jgi:glycosyltransferase involved in cell wall biosynthesis
LTASELVRAPPLAVVAPVHPLVSGAAQFNTAMLAALRDRGPVTAISWRRLYPPLVHRRDSHDLRSRPVRIEPADQLLDWADPRTWSAARRRIDAAGARALVLPWVHPVMAPPYRYLLGGRPAGLDRRAAGRRPPLRVVICHNVRPHEAVPLGTATTRAVLRRADLLVVHAAAERTELDALGLRHPRVLDAFHPRFAAGELSIVPTPDDVQRERRRQGNPDISLLTFGAIRPYKGVDVALEAIAKVPARLRVRLTVAGVFWDGGAELRARVRALGLEDRVELRDEFVSNEDAALLFMAADAALLPYRSATQSGVVALSFAYGTPVIATSVGGLPEAIEHGVDGILCPPGNASELADAIVTLPGQVEHLEEGVRRGGDQRSFGRYAELLNGALDELVSVDRRARVALAVGHAPAQRDRAALGSGA